MRREPVKERSEYQDNEARLAALFDSCYPRIVRYVYSRTGNPTEAEDIASEVFVRAFESLDRYRDKGAPMEAWLFSIARNLVIDHYRRSGKLDRVTDDEGIELQSSDDTAGHAEQCLLMGDVRAALHHLSADQREVVTLRFFGGLSSREVALIMNKGHGAVREMQRAALEKLRGLLGTDKS
ncbi:MAG: RNA polymerase sigma factor [Chloroflexota bacterium]